MTIRRIHIFWIVLGFIWSLPNTLIGMLIGLAGLGWNQFVGNKTATVSFDRGVFLFERNPAIVRNSALSLGFSHIYANEACQVLAQGVECRAHEDQHTIQAMLLGPLFLPVYFICGVIAVTRGSSPISSKNPMEAGPYSNPPRPWP